MALRDVLLRTLSICVLSLFIYGLYSIFIRDSKTQTLLQNSSFSSSSFPSSDWDLATAIISHADAHAKSQRMIIRHTWLKYLQNGRVNSTDQSRTCGATVHFLIGTLDLDAATLKDLEKEQQQYGDMLLVPWTNGYRDHSMAQKYQLWLRHVMKQPDSSPKFLLRVTHDVYVNLPAVCSALEVESPSKLYWGFIIQNGKVLRDPSHRNADLSYLMCGDHYHPYISGVGWIITADIARWLISGFAPAVSPRAPTATTTGQNQASSLLPMRMFLNDDVTMGLAMTVADVAWKHDPRFKIVFRPPKPLPPASVTALIEAGQEVCAPALKDFMCGYDFLIAHVDDEGEGHRHLYELLYHRCGC